MDCGPAALTALLGAHGLPANLDVLREVCATGIDGTSVDDIEEVAQRLGLDAEQVVMPLELVLAAPDRHLPAILLTRTPDGYVHLVVAWRLRRGRLDLVDPAVGRRRVRLAQIRREALCHSLTAPAEAWSAYALGDEARDGLVAALRARCGLAEDDARREVEAARSIGPIDGLGALMGRIAQDGRPPVTREGVGADSEALVRVRGAVLVRAPHGRPLGEAAPELAEVFTEPRRPGTELKGLLGAQRAQVVATAVISTLVGVVAVGELLAARRMLEDGATTARLLVLGSLVAVAGAAAMAATAMALSTGRRIERTLRERLLARVCRLGDAYVRSRPAGDLAERGHALVLVRRLIELGALGVQRLAQAVAAALAIVLLAPAAWPAALVVIAAAVLAPWRLAVWLAEPDLRARAAQGAIGLQLTDALGAADALRSQRTAPVLAALHAPLLALWARAATSSQMRLAAGVLAVELCGLLATGAAAGLSAGASESPATVVTVAVLAFAATVAAQDVAFVARRLVPLRNALLRVMEPLAVMLADAPPVEGDPDRGPGVELTLQDVDVTLGRSVVLDGVSLVLRPGEHVAVVGSSGAGKSSLVAALAGWLRPTAGAITVDGHPLTQERLAGLRRATAWADASTWIAGGTLTTAADQAVAEGAACTRERLTLVGLGARSGSEDTSSLSGPDRQRLLLARALGRPAARLVLLDEALGELDDGERRTLVAHAREVWRGATLVHVTHDVAGAADLPRVIVVEDGSIVEDGVPGTLAADPRSRFRALLDSQRRLEERIGPRTADRAATASPGSQTSLPRPPVADALRTIAVPVAFALLVSLVATVVLAVCGGRIDGGARAGHAGELGWTLGTVSLLVLAATLLGGAALLLGRAGVRLGAWLRRRSLAGAVHARGSLSTVGSRVGAVFDLELLEASALGAGTTLAFAVVEGVLAFALLLLTAQPAGAAALLVAMLLAALLSRRLYARGGAAAAARTEATAHLVDRLLALRTVTMQEDPRIERTVRARLVADLEHAHARVDALRVVLAGLPRLTVLVVIGTLALDPPAAPTAAAGALGATLLAYGALERLAGALADLAPALASARSAWPLLARPPALQPEDPTRALRLPAARPSHVLHQPLAANALLATGTWPPTDDTLEALRLRLDAVALGAVVGRMPLGLGQPLGETGWRLSQGERARIVLVRGLMAEPAVLLVGNPLGALDPVTAERVLDALVREPCDVVFDRS